MERRAARAVLAYETHWLPYLAPPNHPRPLQVNSWYILITKIQISALAVRKFPLNPVKRFEQIVWAVDCCIRCFLISWCSVMVWCWRVFFFFFLCNKCIFFCFFITVSFVNCSVSRNIDISYYVKYIRLICYVVFRTICNSMYFICMYCCLKMLYTFQNDV